MIDKKIMETFFDNNIRPDAIIHLGLQCIDEDSWPDRAEDAFDDDSDQIWEAIGMAPPEGGQYEKWEIVEQLIANRKLGFLIKFATPVPRDFTANGYSTNGWGNYTTRWIYADNLEGACKKAIEWHRDYIQRKRNAAQAGVGNQ